jgi:hypothetical protein
MQTYRLTPVRIDAEEWDYSIRHDAVQVVAENETEARNLATQRYVIGAPSTRGVLAAKSPWSSSRLVQAQVVDHPDPAMPLLDAQGMGLRKAGSTLD